MTIIDVPVSDISAAPRLPAEGETGVVNIGSLTLESGIVLPDVSIAVQRWGELSHAADNVVMVLHALTGDSHVTGPAGPSTVMRRAGSSIRASARRPRCSGSSQSIQ